MQLHTISILSYSLFYLSLSLLLFVYKFKLSFSGSLLCPTSSEQFFVLCASVKNHKFTDFFLMVLVCLCIKKSFFLCLNCFWRLKRIKVYIQHTHDTYNKQKFLKSLIMILISLLMALICWTRTLDRRKIDWAMSQKRKMNEKIWNCKSKFKTCFSIN